MALDDIFSVNRPNQQVGGTNPLELAIEEYTGAVMGTIERRSKTAGWIPMVTVRGTTTVRDEAVGASALQAIVPGVTNDGSNAVKFSKNTLTVEKHLLARETLAELDTFQTHRDKRIDIGMEHGKTISKFMDNALLIQAIKASQLANSTFFANATELPGHSGGSTEVLATAGDALDPAALVQALLALLVKMENKDVDPHMDDLVLWVKPAQFYALLQAEQLINANYVTANGNEVQGGFKLKAYGIPVVSTLNYAGGSVVAGHLLSTTLNGSAFDGDFSKVVATIAAPKAVLAGETIPLTTEVFRDPVSKLWFVDAHLSFSATPRRAEYAGSILIP